MHNVFLVTVAFHEANDSTICDRDDLPSWTCRPDAVVVSVEWSPTGVRIAVFLAAKFFCSPSSRESFQTTSRLLRVANTDFTAGK